MVLECSPLLPGAGVRNESQLVQTEQENDSGLRCFRPPLQWASGAPAMCGWCRGSDEQQTAALRGTFPSGLHVSPLRNMSGVSAT